MVNSAEQLKKAKNQLAKLKKDFPKGFPKFQGFTIQLQYGGNKHVDIADICLGSISTKNENFHKEFYQSIISEIEGSIEFWEKAVQKDIEELIESLKF